MKIYGFFRDGVDAAGMPRVTTRQATQGEYCTPKQSVARDSLDGILGAGGIETAVRPDHWADQVLIATYHEDDESSHWRLRMLSHASSNVRLRRLGDKKRESRVHSTTTSTAGNSLALFRKLSRTVRLSRFRSTARGAHRFEIAKPMRGVSVVPVRASTRNPLPWKRLALAKTRLKAAASLSRN